MLQLKSEINEKLTMLRVGNTYNEAITINNSSIWSLWGEPFDTKDITRVIVFPASHLANVLTKKIMQTTQKNTQLNTSQ